MDRVKKSHRRANERAKKSLASIKSDKYLPSKAEQQLLNVVLNPENATLNVTELCQVAEISRETFYTAMRKSEFKKLLREETFNLISPALPGVVNRFIKEGKAGSYQHGKVVLEMGNVYTPKVKGDIVMTMMTTEKLVEKLKTNPESVTEDERERLGRLTGVVNDDGSFSLHLLLIEWKERLEAGADVSNDWRFLLLKKPVREIVENAERDDEINKHLPELKKQVEKEERERTKSGQKADRKKRS